MRSLGLLATAAALADIVALATEKRWGATELLEHIADIEEKDRAVRGLARRKKRSKLERFELMMAFVMVAELVADGFPPLLPERNHVELLARPRVGV